MKFSGAVSLVLIILVLPIYVNAQQQVIHGTSEDGRPVLLFPNGTWMYEDSTSKLSTQKLTCVSSDRVPAVQVCFDESKWSEVDPTEIDHEKSFLHAKGDAYAVLIVERITVPLSSMKGVAIANMESAGATKIDVISERTFKIGQTEFLQIVFDMKIGGVNLSYYGRYWAGKSGTVQLIAATGQNLAEEFEDDFEILLSNLKVPAD